MDGSGSQTLSDKTLTLTETPDLEKFSPVAKPSKSDEEAQRQIKSPVKGNVFARCLTRICCAIRQSRNQIFGEYPRIKVCRIPRIRDLDTFDTGYPNLAAFKDSSECFMLYRRFGYLQARVLLDKQDELRRLEDELDKYDRDNIGYVTTTVLPFDQAAVRKVLFEKIEQSFNAYASFLTKAQQLMAFGRPSDSEYTSVYNYLDNMAPIHKKERAYIDHKEDLVTLRQGREHAWLDRVIEYTLKRLQRPAPWLTDIFRSKTTKLKYRGGDEVYFTPERINICATGVIMIFILALLMIPIYLLYHLIARSQGVFDGKTTATCIGILLISTLAFSAALSLFTRAKRHEILGAAAAYCAVLVVFLGNVR